MSSKRRRRGQKWRALEMGWAMVLLALARLVESADQYENGFLRVCFLVVFVGNIYILRTLLSIERRRSRRSVLEQRNACKPGPPAAKSDGLRNNKKRSVPLSDSGSKSI